jgi:hypothetical protein
MTSKRMYYVLLSVVGLLLIGVFAGIQIQALSGSKAAESDCC